MMYDVDVEFGKTKVRVRCAVYGPTSDDWHEEGIYCDGDLTNLLRAVSEGPDWKGYDDLIDRVAYELTQLRRNKNAV